MSFDHTLSLLVKNDYLGKSNEGLYTIKMRKIITRCYKNSVLQWIMTKYGNEARKILCLLQNGEYYEPHVIARLCLLDEKDAKRVLYRVVLNYTYISCFACLHVVSIVPLILKKLIDSSS